MSRTFHLTLLLLFAAAAAQADRLTLFAAASTGTALEKLGALWSDHTGHDLSLSLAASSALARQIQQGAPADLFLSASTDWMDVLQRDGLLAPETRRDLLGNRLVLIAAARAPDTTLQNLPQALGDERLAMALVTAVPAGIYGKAALTSLGLWEVLAPSVAQTDNVRAALRLVESEEAPYGITYATDAVASASVRIITEFDPGSHAPIRYPIAALAEGNVHLAKSFLEFLKSPDAQSILAAQGFDVLP